jgi:hypothetical protein
MATTTSKTPSTRSTITPTDELKNTTSKELSDLKEKVETLTKRLSAAEAKLAKPAVASAAPTGDFVSRGEWNIFLKKLGSYIGFDLRAR